MSNPRIKGTHFLLVALPHLVEHPGNVLYEAIFQRVA